MSDRQKAINKIAYGLTHLLKNYSNYTTKTHELVNSMYESLAYLQTEYVDKKEFNDLFKEFEEYKEAEEKEHRLNTEIERYKNMFQAEYQSRLELQKKLEELKTELNKIGVQCFVI